MERGICQATERAKAYNADVKSDRILHHGYRRVRKKASRIGETEGRANEPFFSDRKVLQQPRITQLSLDGRRNRAQGGTKERGKSTLARSPSYGGNFQASGFPGNLWRGHSLDRHERYSPSFIRPCYRSGPFGPAGVTRVIRERRAFTPEKEHVSSDGTSQAWQRFRLPGNVSIAMEVDLAASATRVSRNLQRSR